LIGFFCTNPGFDVEPKQLRSFLLERLPEYMVPLSMKEVESLPLSANGKLDRSALPLLESEIKAEQAFVAPRTDTEARVSEIWKEILGIEQAGVESDFFSLGGDSMLAIKLLVALRHTFKCEIALRDVFLKPTIAKQADLIGELEELARAVAPEEVCA
jgi:acyl carrier protein